MFKSPGEPIFFVLFSGYIVQFALKSTARRWEEGYILIYLYYWKATQMAYSADGRSAVASLK